MASMTVAIIGIHLPGTVQHSAVFRMEPRGCSGGTRQGRGTPRRGRALKGEVRLPNTNFTCRFTTACPPHRPPPRDHPRTEDCGIFMYSLVRYLLRLNIYWAPNKLLSLSLVAGGGRGTDNVPKPMAQYQAHWKDQELQRATCFSLDLRH